MREEHVVACGRSSRGDRGDGALGWLCASAALITLAACGAAERHIVVGGADPACIEAPPGPDGLGFLEGHWSYFDVDWGFDAWFSPRPDGSMVGGVDAHGPRGVNGSNHLRISRRGDELQLEWRRQQGFFPMPIAMVSRRAESGRDRALFSDGEHSLELRRSAPCVLEWRWDGAAWAYTLRRQAVREEWSDRCPR